MSFSFFYERKRSMTIAKCRWLMLLLFFSCQKRNKARHLFVVNDDYKSESLVAYRTAYRILSSQCGCAWFANEWCIRWSNIHGIDDATLAAPKTLALRLALNPLHWLLESFCGSQACFVLSCICDIIFALASLQQRRVRAVIMHKLHLVSISSRRWLFQLLFPYPFTHLTSESAGCGFDWVWVHI